MMRNRSAILSSGLAVVILSACSQGSNGEVVATDESELTNIGTNNQLTSHGFNETAVLAVPYNADLSTIVVGFNPNYTNNSQGWSYSSNGGSTWVTHTSTDSGYAWPALPSPLSDGNPYQGFISDPALAWTGYDEGVAYLAVVASTKTSRCDIGVAVSTNGGMTFTQTASVSDTSSAPGADQPVAATDPTNHAVWVWWRTASHAFLRPIYFSATGISSMGSIIDITNKLPINTAISGSVNIAIKPAASAGQNPTIYLAYPDKWTQNGACGGNPPPGIANVTWRFSWSTDGGQTFSTNTILNDPEWPYCIFNQANGENRNRPAIAYDPVSGYVLTAINQSVKNTNGVLIGTRVILHQSGDNYATQGSWLPLCNSNADLQLIEGLPGPTETACDQFDPELAVTFYGSTTSYAAFAWHDTRDNSDGQHVDIWGGSVKPGSPYDYQPRTLNRITPLSSNVPWLETDKSGNTPWGDYDGMAGDPRTWGDKFYAAWGDNRNGGDAEVFEASFAQ